MKRNKRKAIIVDIDNTICIDKIQTPIPASNDRLVWNKFHAEHRWYNVNNFMPIQEVVDYITFLYETDTENKMFIFLSAREDHENQMVFLNTLRLIRKYFPQFNEKNYGKNYMLLLRFYNDFGSDENVKRNLCEKYIKKIYSPIIAIDDKTENINMFKEIGVPLTIQINKGNKNV